MESRKINTIYCGKWFCYYSLEFTDPSTGVVFKDIECIKRTTKKKALEYDALTIVPTIKYSTQKKRKVLLIAEFRPPVQSFVLEFPAGLAETEDFMDDIEREMLEETGYVVNSEKIYVSPLITAEPDLFEITAKIFVVEINGEDERNKNPKQQLETTENIRVHLVDLDDKFLEKVEEMAKENNYLIHDKIYFFGNGLCQN